MSGICLAAAGFALALGASDITLSWRHSVEKTLWRERWTLEDGGLRLAEAYVEGTGAGMEPPPEARRSGQGWAWRPRLPALREVVLRRSGATADWQLCRQGRCEAMDALVPPAADPVRILPCSPQD